MGNALRRKEWHAVDDKHIECVSDFAGNYKSPGAWADLWERHDGTRYISLGGGWAFYAPHHPGIIEATDPRFAGFIAACETGDDFGYVAKHWN